MVNFLKSRLAAALILAVALSPSIALAQNVADPTKKTPDPASSPAPAAEPVDARIAQLIRQLGNPTFATRQQATRELQAIGPAAKEPLIKALTHPDAEVRLRAQRILVYVLEADFMARLDAFEADVDGKKKHDLPCWTAFRKVVGESPAARQLFVDAVRAEPVLLETVEQDPRTASEAILLRCDALVGGSSRLRNRLSERSETPQVATGRMAALLLAACATETPVTDAVGIKIYQLFHRSKLVDEISDSSSDLPARRLLGAWIERTADSNMAFQSIWLAMRYQLKEGIVPATLLLKRSDQQPYVRQTAILAVGKLGNQKHVALLEPLLSDSTSCESNPDEEKTPHRCEIRDVALASIIHLHGLKPKDFGFEKIQQNSQTLFQQNSMGFAGQSQRAAALTRWKTWLAEHPAAKPKP